MRVLLIRHGAAEYQKAFAKSGEPDEKRPLTRAGRDQMRAVARGLKPVVKDIDVLATSPLTRARQTADVAAERFDEPRRETIAALVPGAPFSAFVEWLRQHEDDDLVAAVGHNPHISELATWLMGAGQPIDMKKASALLLELGDEIGEGKGQLRWYMTPKQLSALGE